MGFFEKKKKKKDFRKMTHAKETLRFQCWGPLTSSDDSKTFRRAFTVHPRCHSQWWTLLPPSSAVLNVNSWTTDVHTQTVYKHLLCKLQKAENIFMTLQAAEEALATEVSRCVGLLYSKCLHQEEVTTVMKASHGLFLSFCSGEVRKCL